MKKLRKIVSLLLAVVMMMSLCAVQVMANTVTVGSGDGSITITANTSGETYKIYKMLDLTIATNDSEETTGYSYTIESTSDWYDFFETGDGSDYVIITTSASGVNYVTWNSKTYSSTDGYATFAQLAIAYADDKDISETASGVADDKGVKFDRLELGYYLVTSSIGSVVSLDSTDPDVEIRDKNGKPTVEKTVSDSEDGTYGTTSTADINDVVYFKIDVIGIDTATSLTLHDVLDGGLTFGSVYKVELYKDNSDTDPIVLSTRDPESYTLNGSIKDGCSFEIIFDALLAEKGTAGSSYETKVTSDDAFIRVYYTATVNSSAVIGSTGNKNTTWASTGTSYTSTEDYTTTYVYELYVYKYTGDLSGTYEALDGAKFILYYEDSSSTKHYAVMENDLFEEWTTEVTKATELTSDTYGLVNFSGIAAGTYYVLETEAPDGYALLTTATSITIADDGTISGTTRVAGDGQGSTVNALAICNGTSSEMPSTGGIGVTIFYVLGGVIVVAAVVLIVVLKKRTAKVDR